MKRFYLFLMVACMIAFKATSQSFSPMKVAKEQNIHSIGEIQDAFYEWSQTQDITKIKGNKPFYRWMWFNQMRQPVDENQNIMWEHFQAAQWLKSQKANAGDFAPNAWVPVGPFDLVPSTSSSPIHDIGRLNCIAFHPTNPDIFWVGAPQGGIWKTSDGGQNWMPLGDDLPAMRISDIAVQTDNPDVMYVCLGDYGYMGLFNVYVARPTHYGLGVYKTTDGGLSWNPTGLTYMIEEGFMSLMRRVFINPENSNELVAAGTSGVFRSVDGGNDWTQINDYFIWDFEQVPGNYKTIYATTFEGLTGITGVYKSLDFGVTWQYLNTNIPKTDSIVRVEVIVAPSDTSFVYATCGGFDDAFYGFYRSTDAGQTWEMTADSSQINIFGQYTGDHTNKLAQSSYDLWMRVDKYDPEIVYTGAMNIWGSKDGGETWNICSMGFDWFGESIHYDHHFVKENPLDEKIYFCCDGGLFRTDSLVLGNSHLFDSCYAINHLTPDCYQFETQWENLSSGLVITEFYRLGLSANNPGYVIAGSQDNCVFYKNSLDEWVNLTQGDGMECMIHPNNPQTLYASNQFGVLYRSYNGGQNMTTNPVTLPILYQEGAGVWITPFLMDQQQPETIYAGFRNVWKSVNNGSSWAKISNFANMPGYSQPKPIWDMAICPTISDVIYISKQPYPAANIGNAGELWRTTDGGQSWTNITSNVFPVYSAYVNDIAVTENPDKAYIVSTGFVPDEKVFMTEDGGQTWVDISGTLPNIAVTSIVYQLGSPLHDLYIGTDLGVFYKNDNYPDWQPFSDNLPNVIVNELEIDYVESKLYAATYGRGIWAADLINPVTGINPQETPMKDLEATVSPNPCRNMFSLSMNSDRNREIQFEIIDILGDVVLKDKLNIPAGNYEKSFDLSDQPAGVYFVRLSSDFQSKVCRVIKE